MGNKPDQRQTFARLMDSHGPALRRLVRVYLTNPAAQDDLFQEIAMAIWVGLPAFRGDSTERTWLYRIAHNTAAEQLHKLQRRRERERQQNDTDPEPAHHSTPESDLQDQRKHQRFLAALRSLPPLDFQIVTMSLAGLSYQEIAEVVGLTQTNVGAKLSRIRQTLTNCIAEHEVKP